MKEKSEKKLDAGKKQNSKKKSENAEQELQENNESTYQLKTKTLPAILMLTGGAVASIVTFLNHYSLKEMLMIVLLVLIVFYILGMLLKRLFDSFHIVLKENEEDTAEGEVIEKTPASEEAVVTEKSGK